MRALYIIVISIFTLLRTTALYAQDCEKAFIETMLNTYKCKEETFHKEALRSVKKYSNSDYKHLINAKVLNIPVVFSREKGAKICKGEVDKKNLLCYLDGKKMAFDETLIYLDTLVLGAIIQDPNPNNELKYENDTFRKTFIRPLITEIRKINPDIIFSVYNLSGCYWYIKENQLYVLSFEHKNTQRTNFKVHTVAHYIENYLKNENLCFLSPKRIIRIN